MADETTTPPDETAQGGQGGRRGARAAATVKRGDVVHFTATDTHTGDEYSGLGVVANVGNGGGPVTVRPLAGYTVQAADVELVVTDEG